MQTVELTDASLRSFEQAVCDQSQLGCWVYIDKHVPKEEETAANPAAKKPPAPAKGKGPATGIEDLKPQHSKAWLNLIPLLHPGVKTLTQRIMLMPVTPRELPEKSSSAGGNTTPVNASSVNDPPASAVEVEDIYTPCQTYVYLTVNLSEALYPEPTQVKTDTSSLLLKFKEPKKNPGTKDAIATYESAIKYIVSQVGQEYAKKAQEDDGGAPTNKNGGQVGKGQTAFLNAQQTEMLAESRRERFLTEFTQSYKYTEIRSRL